MATIIRHQHFCSCQQPDHSCEAARDSDSCQCRKAQPAALCGCSPREGSVQGTVTIFGEACPKQAGDEDSGGKKGFLCTSTTRTNQLLSLVGLEERNSGLNGLKHGVAILGLTAKIDISRTTKKTFAAWHIICIFVIETERVRQPAWPPHWILDIPRVDTAASRREGLAC